MADFCCEEFAYHAFEVQFLPHEGDDWFMPNDFGSPIPILFCPFCGSHLKSVLAKQELGEWSIG